MLHLHLIPETPAWGPAWACSEIRLLRPYKHPWMRRHLEVTAGPGLLPGRLDVVALQRSGWPEASLDDVVVLLRDIRGRGAKLIYDLDDNLLSEHPDGATEASVAPVRPRVRVFLREADAVIVPTIALAERVRHLNPRVFVWPNAIDETLAGDLHQFGAEDGADIGYFGTSSHLPDLLAVVGALEAALDGLPGRPTVELCGIASDFRIASLLAARCTVTMLPVNGDYASFQAQLQRAPWKVGLAPLVDCAFNRCKSDIKFLDHALAGIPGVYSDCVAYGAVADGETGLKVPLGEFGIAVRRLLEDPRLRGDIRAAARRQVLEDRTLARRVPDLWDILQRVS